MNSNPNPNPNPASPSATTTDDRTGATQPFEQENHRMSQNLKPNAAASDQEKGPQEDKDVGNNATTSTETVPKDPFDLANISVSSVTSEDLGVEKPIIVVPVDKPSKQSFFRVHPDPTFRTDARIIRLDAERESYLVTNQIWPAIPGETKFVRLIPYITREGGLGLWPVSLPDDLLGKKDSNWAITARAAAEYAETKWVRMSANMQLGRYDVMTSASIPDPVWPKITFREILEKAFGKDHLIDSLDHPIIRQLQGEG